jgi:hypothetical protein
VLAYGLWSHPLDLALGGVILAAWFAALAYVGRRR